MTIAICGLYTRAINTRAIINLYNGKKLNVCNCLNVTPDGILCSMFHGINK